MLSPLKSPVLILIFWGIISVFYTMTLEYECKNKNENCMSDFIIKETVMKEDLPMICAVETTSHFIPLS